MSETVVSKLQRAMSERKIVRIKYGDLTMTILPVSWSGYNLVAEDVNNQGRQYLSYGQITSCEIVESENITSFHPQRSSQLFSKANEKTTRTGQTISSMLPAPSETYNSIAQKDAEPSAKPTAQ